MITKYFYLFLCALSFAIEYLFGNIALKYIDNTNLIALRYIITGCILFILILIINRKEFIGQINRYSVLYSILIGFFSILSSYFLYILLKDDDYIKVVPTVEPLIVIISFIIGIIYYKNKISLKLIFGIVLSIIGVYLINTSH